jgi:hypothetical protein
MARTTEFQLLMEDGPEPQAVTRRELCNPTSSLLCTLTQFQPTSRGIKSTKNNKYNILQHSPDR